MIGLGLIVFSYLIAWPLIALLGILAVHHRKPAIFAVGSPLAYILSYLVFILGAWLAGKDGLKYIIAFGRRTVAPFFRKYIKRQTD